MTCNVCHEHRPALHHWSLLDLSVKGGVVKIGAICETCASKIEDLLKALGWRLT